MVVPGARNHVGEALFFGGNDGEVRSRASGRVREVVTKKHAEKTSCPNEPTAGAILRKKDQAEKASCPDEPAVDAVIGKRDKTSRSEEPVAGAVLGTRNKGVILGKRVKGAGFIQKKLSKGLKGRRRWGRIDFSRCRLRNGLIRSLMRKMSQMG